MIFLSADPPGLPGEVFGGSLLQFRGQGHLPRQGTITHTTDHSMLSLCSVAGELPASFCLLPLGRGMLDFLLLLF